MNAIGIFLLILILTPPYSVGMSKKCEFWDILDITSSIEMI